MAYVTQTRKVANDHSYQHIYVGVGPAGSLAGTFPTDLGYAQPVQTTTGFRSGKSAERLVDQDDIGTDPSSISAGTFSQLKKEIDHSGATSYDNGHTFDTSKQEVVAYSVVNERGRSSSFQYADYIYRGPCVPDVARGTMVPTGYPLGQPKVTNMTWWEQRAIENSIPTTPVANLGQGTAEIIREGIPAMIGSILTGGKEAIHRAIGGEHLNYQFGWLPIISDLKAIARVVVDHELMLRQLERDSGRNVRRGHNFEPLVDVTHQEWAGSACLQQGLGPIFLDALTHGGTKLIQIDRRETKIWFSGAYTYHLQERDQIAKLEAERTFQQAQYLLGLELTPEVLWELAPWSWLSDWYGNIGTNMSLATRFQNDGLVLRYGYLMVETTHQRERFAEGVALNGHTVPCSITVKTTTKSRRKATPYGFALNPTSFTGRQWAILGALGMTKSPNSLR